MSSRLPIMPTMLAAYRDVFGAFPAFMRVSWFMLALLLLVYELPIYLLSGYVETHVLSTTPQVESGAADMPQTETAPVLSDEEKAARIRENIPVLLTSFSLNILRLILIFCYTYAWYRQLLTGENKGSTIFFRLGRNELRFIWTNMKVGFVLLPLAFLGFGVVTGAMPQAPSAPPQYEVWPYLLVIGGGLLYLQARMAAACPAVVMEETGAPIRQSWNLTKRQSLPLIVGNLMIAVPVVAGIMAISYGVGQALFFLMPSLVGPVLKILGEFVTLILIGLLSAFQAHAYAYLVRSSSSASIH